jgi:hypothetical protein
MKTFYDFRNQNWINPNETSLKGIVIWKTKYKWLLWIKEHGLMVCPRSIYLYNWYIPKNIIDSFKYLFKK